MTRFFDAIKGGAAPWLVGLLRGMLEAAAFAAGAVVIAFLAAGQLPDWLIPWAPVLVIGIRTVEGVLDGIDPTTDRTFDGSPFDR